MPDKKRQDFIWDKIIYAHPIKDNQTLRELDPYKPLVTFDNHAEIGKVKKYAPQAGLMLRVKVPNTGAVVELSSKFGALPGEAVSLIEAAFNAGLVVEGLSFHVGSQCTNFENYVQALNLVAGIFHEAWERGYPQVKILDIGGGFPVPYDNQVKPFRTLAKAAQRRTGSPVSQRHGNPGRTRPLSGGHGQGPWSPPSSARPSATESNATTLTTACTTRSRGSSSTTSPIRSKPSPKGPHRSPLSSGPRATRLDTISLADELPDLDLGDLVYSENIGAYSHASSTYFNGFPPAKVVHINRD